MILLEYISHIKTCTSNGLLISACEYEEVEKEARKLRRRSILCQQREDVINFKLYH